MILNLEKEIVIQGLVRKINVNNEDIADQKKYKICFDSFIDIYSKITYPKCNGECKNFLHPTSNQRKCIVKI